MKLELKHLAPYLPYGLQAEMLDYRRDYVGIKYDTIIGFHQWSKKGDWCVLTNGGSKPDLLHIKPMFRPLSDIEEYFKPLFETDEEVREYLDSNFLNGFDIWIEELETLDYNYYPHSVFDLLCKHHFDVFGLIEKGLAIDLNTKK